MTAGLYPAGTEFLHSVRYLDPDSPTFMAQRMKELRYMKKATFFERDAVLLRYEDELAEKELGRLPEYPGDPIVGYRNAFGWQLQGFIEDAEGRLRAQTEEEHRFCMGCHTGIGVTIDQTFSFARKVPGLEGWRPQDPRGIRDVPQRGHTLPEYAEYLLRVGGGDELRANDEMLTRFFQNGALAMAEVRRAARGGDRDITHLIVPSRARALALDRAYLVTVHEQSYTRGRDATVRPAANVHRRVENGDTEFGRTGWSFAMGRYGSTGPSRANAARTAARTLTQPGTAYGAANRRSRTNPLPARWRASTFARCLSSAATRPTSRTSRVERSTAETTAIDNAQIGNSATCPRREPGRATEHLVAEHLSGEQVDDRLMHHRKTIASEKTAQHTSQLTFAGADGLGVTSRRPCAHGPDASGHRCHTSVTCLWRRRNRAPPSQGDNRAE